MYRGGPCIEGRDAGRELLAPGRDLIPGLGHKSDNPAQIAERRQVGRIPRLVGA